MMKKAIFILLAVLSVTYVFATRNERMLKDGWQFAKGEESPSTRWEDVTIPHDWAIYGPFDRSYDLQEMAVTQNGETKKTVKTGRTGGLPYVGKGVYKTTFNISSINNRSITLLFDGAMSEAHVEVNGKEVCYWAYGYNSFHCSIDNVVKNGENTLTVRLQNRPESSRWYPGAGLYRNVHIIETSKIHVPMWGTYITTPYVGNDYATVKLETKVAGCKNNENVTLSTVITDNKGNVVAQSKENHVAYNDRSFTQNFVIDSPQLWSPETPTLYMTTTKVISDGKEVDEYSTRFGVRSIEVRPDKGFFLNGKMRKFKGVCNHHDLGPLGAAINVSALRHQLILLKEMGCDAIRTAHNMPAPELVALCDEMGFMMMIEPFDDWNFKPKGKNNYNIFFNEWAERDMVNMIHNYRNNASVVMWSIGNEVPSQWSPNGMKEEMMLQDICHREDPTRPVTCGMDQFDAVVKNGFGAVLDVPGFNYKVNRYAEAYSKLPQKLILGTETASTVSSRGVYKFPAKTKANAIYDDHQSSSYDTEYCNWSNIPDDDFAADDDLPYVMGQFVWTGFDYLGEPTPYDTDAWPSHSSLFGIFDLASLPKDRFYLYRSKWNTKDATLHILPHWNWEGREGEVTPVFVYTSYPKAELFINGVSQGMREKNDSTVMHRYRLMWNDVKYVPGEVKVVAYDKSGKRTTEKVIRTAGKPHHLVLTTNKTQLIANGEDLAYVTVQVADKDGNIVPTDNRLVKFNVKGAGKFRAAANGDPACITPFQSQEMPLFSGALTVIVQSATEPGEITLDVKAKGVTTAKVILQSK